MFEREFIEIITDYEENKGKHGIRNSQTNTSRERRKITSGEKYTRKKLNTGQSVRTSHAWKKLLHCTNFAEPVIASFFGISTNIPCFKVFYKIQIKTFKNKDYVSKQYFGSEFQIDEDLLSCSVKLHLQKTQLSALCVAKPGSQAYP